MIPPRSETSYILHDIIPQLEELGYPGAGDHDKVKINDVPIYRPSGGRSGSTIDIVYYHNGEPLLLVEAKRRHQSHEDALEEAKNYLRNFPVDEEEYAPSGKAPSYIATTVGREIKFYFHQFDIQEGQLIQISKEVDSLNFDQLISVYGLKPDFIPEKLSPIDFREKFLNELISVFVTDIGQGITPEVIKNISWLILTYLRFPNNYTNQSPYIDLQNHRDRQRHVVDLFRRFNLIDSLGKEIAWEFRNFILRAFQGSDELNQYLTPQIVIALMMNLVNISEDDKVLDFECGSGGYIAAAIERRVALENVRGVDIADLPFYVAKTYLALYFKKHGEEIDSLPITLGNGLVNLGAEWDVVIGNPAGGSQYDPEEELDDIDQVLQHLEQDLDLDGRDDSFSEYNFSIQQAVRSCKVGGRICLVLPEGFFTNSTDDFLRRYVAKYYQVKAIISLPRGVFRKGTTTRTVQSGNIGSNQKMSILFAKKIKQVEDGSGLDLDLDELDYPVFLASVQKPENSGSNPDDWLEEPLARVLEEWNHWKENGTLIEENSPIETKRQQYRVEIQRTQQQRLIEPEAPLLDRIEKESKPPESSKKTLIPEFLRKLFE